jgi:hypothetical protein
LEERGRESTRDIWGRQGGGTVWVSRGRRGNTTASDDVSDGGKQKRQESKSKSKTTEGFYKASSSIFLTHRSSPFHSSLQTL